MPNVLKWNYYYVTEPNANYFLSLHSSQSIAVAVGVVAARAIITNCYLHVTTVASSTSLYVAIGGFCLRSSRLLN